MLLLSSELTDVLRRYLKHSEEAAGLWRPAGYSPNKHKEERRATRRPELADLLERDRNAISRISAICVVDPAITSIPKMSFSERVVVLRAILELEGVRQTQDGEVAKAIQILERYCGKSSCLLVGLKSHDQYMKIFRGAMAQTAVAG